MKPHPRIRKTAKRGILVLSILFIAAGANVVIAVVLYARAVAGGTPTVPPTILSSPAGVWLEPSPAWPAPHVATVSCAAFDATSYALRAQWTPTGFVSTQTNPDVSRFWQEIKVGVPFRCASQRIRHETWHVPVPSTHTPAPRFDDGFPVGGVNLPGRPIWPGFIANTVIIASLLLLGAWLLRRAIRLLAPQRRLRIARGLCGTCGYDRHGLAADMCCPECGKTVA